MCVMLKFSRMCAFPTIHQNPLLSVIGLPRTAASQRDGVKTFFPLRGSQPNGRVWRHHHDLTHTHTFKEVTIPTRYKPVWKTKRNSFDLALCEHIVWIICQVECVTALVFFYAQSFAISSRVSLLEASEALPSAHPPFPKQAERGIHLPTFTCSSYAV